ncbi:MAG: type II secretory pathway component GspD/PulD (secretin) [Planctomycetota bacterium]
MPTMRNPLLSVLLMGCLTAACATATLDSGTAPSTTPSTTIIYLQHTKAEEMADTVEQFLAEARASGVSYPTIRAHGESNALLLEGKPKNMQKVLTLITNLDVQRPK